MKPHKQLLGAALLFIALITGVAVWIVHVAAPPTAESRLKRSAAMRVGFAPEAPYAFYDAQGNVTGEAPEIFRLMAHRLGIERIDWVRVDSANLLPELQLGRIDAIATGMFITPERMREASFTRPTASVLAALIVRQGETRLPLQPLRADLKHPALRWSTVHGATGIDLLDQAGVPPQQIVTVPQAWLGLRAVAEGDVDAFAISVVTARHMVSRNPQWALEVRTLDDAPPGLPAFAFRQGDASLRDAMNEVLQGHLGSDEHKALVQRFGFTSDELPPDTP